MMKTPKFKTGDRVRLRNADAEAQRGLLVVGDVGTVLERSGIPYVKWDRAGVGCNQVWAVLQENIELVRPSKPAKKPAPAKWTPRTIEIPAKTTRAVLVDLVHECVAEINQLGTENAKLKNQIAKGKAK